MADYQNFETYLFLKPNKFIISVISDTNDKIFEKVSSFETNMSDIDLDKLDSFLNDNIFDIEKILNNFVKSINLFIDSEIFSSIEMSIKKNNYGELITNDNLNHILSEAKDQCSDTLKDKKLSHILINNYFIDDNKYSNLPHNIKCNHFSLDITFICLPLDYYRNLIKILSNYQISLDRLVSLRYMKNFFSQEKIDLNEMARKIISGHNLNEVVFTQKKPKNMTFFEKFFHFFS